MELPLHGIFSLLPPLPSGLSPIPASASAAHAGTSPAQTDKPKRNAETCQEIKMPSDGFAFSTQHLHTTTE